MSTEETPHGSILDDLVAAIRFLTLLPIPGFTSSQRPLSGAFRLFPLVGLLLGGLLALLGIVSGWLWNDTIRAVLVVIAWAVLTAGLHLDGLSDTFDGVMSWRPRERKLEIMRDSRIGVMGALALIAVLGLKIALLSSPGPWVSALLLAPVLGRWAICYGLCRFPSARPDGLGAMAQAQSSNTVLLWASVLAILGALLIGGGKGLIALLLVWGLCELLARWWVRDLGGLTGDTYGALCELAEVLTLLVLFARVTS